MVKQYFFKFTPKLFLLLMLLTGSTMSFGQQVQYITDVLYVPLRSGAGNQFRIINTSLRSGHRLEIIEGAVGDEWVKVQTENGSEGWIRSQYLSNSESARTRLEKANAQIAALQKTNQELDAKNKELSGNNSALNQQATSANSENLKMANELQRIKTLSADAINLEKRYRELLEKHQMLQTTQEALAVENDKLKSDQRLNFMFYGAGLVLLGVFLSIILPALKPSKRHSEWR